MKAKIILSETRKASFICMAVVAYSKTAVKTTIMLEATTLKVSYADNSKPAKMFATSKATDENKITFFIMIFVLWVRNWWRSIAFKVG